MDALVIGCGSIGRRHVGNLVDVDRISNVFGHDLDGMATQKVSDEHNIWTTTELQEAWEQSPDIVLVCTPPDTHIQLAERALDHDADVFIEKPLSDSLEGLPAFIQQVESSDSTVMIGCNMRFHPPVVKMREWVSAGEIGRLEYAQLQYGNHLSNWRSENPSDQYTAQAEKGGGIILDSIHEIDLLLEWLSDPETVQCAAGTYSDLAVNVEDTAELLVEGPKQLGSVHLDFIRPERARTYELIGTNGIIQWQARGKNPEQSEVELYRMNTETRRQESYELTANEMYISEIEHFIECIRTDSAPVVDVKKGRDALKLALLAKDASQSGDRKQFDANSY